jgi:hypothetical protein
MTLIRSDEYKTAKDGLYAEAMAERLRELNREKRPVTTTQAASTQAILDRPVEQDAAHFWRPLPKDWKANKDADPENLAQVTGQRDFTPEEIVISEDIRHKGRNSLGDAVSLGASSVEPNRKVMAIEAFTYTPPTPLAKEQMTLLTAIAPITPAKPVEYKPQPKFSFKDFFHKLFGGKFHNNKRFDD